MSEVIYLDTNLIARAPRTKPARSRGPQVSVRELLSGLWIVSDGSDRKGGCFADRASAFRFVAETFGPRAGTVVHPCFPGHAAPRLLPPARPSSAIAQ